MGSNSVMPTIKVPFSFTYSRSLLLSLLPQAARASVIVRASNRAPARFMYFISQSLQNPGSRPFNTLTVYHTKFLT